MADRDEAALIRRHCDLMMAVLAAAPGPAPLPSAPAQAQPRATAETSHVAVSAVTSYMGQQLRTIAEGPGRMSVVGPDAAAPLSFTGQELGDPISRAEREMFQTLSPVQVVGYTPNQPANHALHGPGYGSAVLPRAEESRSLEI